MITVYGFLRSRATRAVWALEEIGAEYAFRRIHALKGEHRQPEYLALNPGGKVPTYVEDDFVLRESAAIVTWIGQKRPDLGLVPEAGSRDRALYDQWCFFVLSELEQPLWTAAKHSFVLPERYRVPAVKPTADKEFSWAARVFAEGLGDREWLIGDRFTMADLLAAHTLVWAAKGRGLALGHQTLDAYMARATARPAFGRAVAAEQAAKAG